MSDYTPDVGEIRMIKNALGQENYTLKLYINNITPTDTESGSTTLTMQSALSGVYLGQAVSVVSGTSTIPSGAYVTSLTNSVSLEMSAGATGTASLQTMGFTNQIRGGIMVGASSGDLYRVMPLASAMYPESNGDYVNVTPTITLQTGT